MRTLLEFRVLGPLTIRDGAVELPIRGRGQQLMLAALLLSANRTVTIDRLVHAVWGADVPVTAEGQIRDRIRLLRKTLSECPSVADPAEVLATTEGGYRLSLGAGTTDLDRFRRAAEAGHAALAVGRFAEAAALLRDALAVWRDTPFAGLDAEWLCVPIDGWLERRMSVEEARVDADLRCGHHQQVIAELTELIAAHPLRERLRAQLITALAQAGRTAEALESYQAARHLLAEELGVEPGPHLQQVHGQLLRGELGVPVAALVAVPTVRARPAQLPLNVAAFVGRGRELAVLDGLLPDDTTRATSATAAVLVSAVSGTAGVGKTALAIQWAYRVRDRFPDGQLYVNLRGYDPDRPLSAGEALAQFLAALGVPGPDIPLDVDERAARYRTELSGRRLLIVLDNAGTVDQVRPLLPGAATCMVLVTSRESLAGLVARDGAHRLDLGLLPMADATILLRRLIGRRVDAEPEAATGLAALCARLPLALRIAAELAVARPMSPLADLVAELADQRSRIDLLEAAGDPRTAVSSVFSWSVRHLSPAAARTFRMLGLHVGPDFDAYAVAALTDTDLNQANDAQSKLAQAHLMQATTGTRWTMHDLLRAYASNLAATDPADPGGRAALGRLFDYYLATATAAMNVLYPAEALRLPDPPSTHTPRPAFADADSARAWLDTELATLGAVAGYAAGHGWPGHATGLSTALFRYLDGGLNMDALAIHGYARDAALQTGNRAAQARAMHGLGAAHVQMGQHHSAVTFFQEALSLFRQAGDEVGQARALGNLGLIDWRLGHYPPAANQFQQAVDLFSRAGDRAGEAVAVINLGTLEQRLGRSRRAVELYQRALALSRALGDQYGEAYALNNLGEIQARLDEHAAARENLHRALALFQQIGQRGGEASALDSLGVLHTRLGQPDLAIEHHRHALIQFRQLGDRGGEAQALNGLGEAALASGQPADAITHHDEALVAASEIGFREQQARAHTGLGQAHRVLGDDAHAKHQYEQALRLNTQLGAAEADEVRAQLASLDKEASQPGTRSRLVTEA